MNQKLQQLQQRHAEVSFIIKHHEDLSKAYVRELIFIEQSIAQEQQQSEKQAEEVSSEQQ